MSEEDPTKELKIPEERGKSRERLFAEIGMSGMVTNAMLAQAFSSTGKLDITEAVATVSEKARAVKNGDLSATEGMLAAQAVALDVLFSNMALRAGAYMNRSAGKRDMDAAEKYMRLALKAQSQCRTTIETLSLMKNPQPYVARFQQNIAQNQQVNNVPPPARAREKNPTNELLEDRSHEWMDTGAAATTGRDDKDLAAVAVLDRPAD